MSTDREILAIRRAVYADAWRRGDALATANAAARLRAHVGDLTASELEAVRVSRGNFGQAIRQARSRRLAPPAEVSLPPAIPLSRPRRSRLALAAALALLALVLASVLGQPLLHESEGGSGGAPVALAPDAVLPIIQSRGRVVLAVAMAQPADEAVATAAPETPASPEPAPANGASGVSGSARPSGSGAPGAGTGPGSGGGNGTGTGGGSPSPSPIPTATPAPTLVTCVSPVPRGFARLCGLVVDARTGRAIAGACVSLGACTDQSARTDPNGRWAFVLPVGNGTLSWGFEFSKAGYGTAFYTQTSRQGFITLPTQRLVAAP